MQRARDNKAADVSTAKKGAMQEKRQGKADAKKQASIMNLTKSLNGLSTGSADGSDKVLALVNFHEYILRLRME